MMLLKQRVEADGFLLFLCLFFAPELLSECKPSYQLKKQWPVRWTIGLQRLHFLPVVLGKMYVTHRAQCTWSSVSAGSLFIHL